MIGLMDRLGEARLLAALAAMAAMAEGLAMEVEEMAVDKAGEEEDLIMAIKMIREIMDKGEEEDVAEGKAVDKVEAREEAMSLNVEVEAEEVKQIKIKILQGHSLSSMISSKTTIITLIDSNLILNLQLALSVNQIPYV